MALMYPWATKEYLLWKMSLGQIIMYYNLGFDQLNGGKEEKEKKEYEELKKARDEMRAQGLIDKKENIEG
jgi:hypothetical protein